MATVYMVDARARDASQALVNKIELLLDAAGLEGLVTPGKQQEVVIKTQVGRIGHRGYLRPPFVRLLVDRIHQMGAKPLVVDTNGLGLGRNAGLEWFDNAALHGYTTAILGDELTLAESYTGAEGEVVPAAGCELGSVKIARLIREARSLLVISHVTGHPLTGLAGAITSLGLGCLAGRGGKDKVHRVLKPTVAQEKCDGCAQCICYCASSALIVDGSELRLLPEKCTGCAVCLAICPQRALTANQDTLAALQRRVAEAAMAVTRHLPGRTRYFNFLIDVTPQPDDYPYSDNPFVPDLGVLMSADPVAIDQASIDLINSAPGLPYSAAADAGVTAPGQDKLRSVAGVDPAPLIRQAESLGAGQCRYELLVS